MKLNALKVRFVIHKSRTKLGQKSPIYCRVTYLGNRKNFSTGLEIYSENWDSKLQESKGEEMLNQNLHLIKHKLEEIELYLKIKGEAFSVDDIVALYFNKPKPKNETLISFYKKFLEKQERLIGKEIKQITWNKYYYIFKHLREYLKTTSELKLKLDQLNSKFLHGFEYFLKTEKSNKQITVNKTIQRLRKVIKEAVIEGLIDRDPFYGYKVKKVKHKVVYLSKNELESLEAYDFASQRLAKVRDCFILCCYTGLAYNEMARLNLNHINQKNGINWINIKRSKTDKMLEIPLLVKAEKMLDSYTKAEELKLPVVSNQRFNSYLKEIADIVGINKNLTHHVARKTFATTVLLENKIPVEIVSHVLGHSNVKVTQDHYGKILSSSVASAFKDLNSSL
ncbi:MAG: phage integrase SAM-like domain-containing protein [Psychroflexus halocasei]